MIAFTRAAAVELSPDRVRVNVVLLPGMVGTPASKAQFDAATLAARAKARCRWSRFGAPGDIAGAVAFPGQRRRRLRGPNSSSTAAGPWAGHDRGDLEHEATRRPALHRHRRRQRHQPRQRRAAGGRRWQRCWSPAAAPRTSRWRRPSRAASGRALSMQADATDEARCRRWWRAASLNSAAWRSSSPTPATRAPTRRCWSRRWTEVERGLARQHDQRLPGRQTPARTHGGAGAGLDHPHQFGRLAAPQRRHGALRQQGGGEQPGADGGQRLTGKACA